MARELLKRTKTTAFHAATAVANRRPALIALLIVCVALLAFTTWATGNVHGFRPWFFEDKYDNAFEDLLARNRQIRILQDTGNIYEPFGSEAFTYPPGAIFIFYWTTWLPTEHVPYAWTALTLFSMVALFAIVLRASSRARGLALWTLACWLTMATVAVYPPFIEVLEWGQLAPMLLALIAIDELLLKGPGRGIAVGIASAIKLYPLLFVVAWAFRRQWGAVATALITFATCTAIAALAWPTSAVSFFVDLMWNGQDIAHLASNHATVVSSQSIASMLNRPPIALDPNNQIPATIVAAIVACLGLIGAHRLWKNKQTVSTMVVLIAVSSLCSPVAWDHYFCFAPLLWWVAAECAPRSRLRHASVVAGLILLIPWNFWRRGKPIDAWTTTYEFITRNAIGFAVLSVVVAAALDAWRPRTTHVLPGEPEAALRHAERNCSEPAKDGADHHAD